jgi:hypothetical protein
MTDDPDNDNDNDNLIASPDLHAENVPSADADLSTLEEFCLAIDGCHGERYSIDDLLREAERVEREGLDSASLDELRDAAFIRQRALKWASDGDPAALPPLIAKIRRLVAEIRRRVVKEQGNALR